MCEIQAAICECVLNVEHSVGKMHINVSWVPRAFVKGHWKSHGHVMAG